MATPGIMQRWPFWCLIQNPQISYAGKKCDGSFGLPHPIYWASLIPSNDWAGSGEKEQILGQVEGKELGSSSLLHKEAASM